ncbi:hypothetical protein [Aerococcus viridans]|uniref:hypothetical protein n=1 Tax=Aerococcus viridans TaxID=1377 RepID=UPI002DC06405|nr:hypothetical protein [Aerococcus viridans]MEC1387350.1 hypothetical protein [Aerococcus viridans]
MKKNFLFLITICIFTMLVGGGWEFLNDNEKKIKEFAKDNGYVSATKAIQQFQEKYELKVSLPSEILFEPTHSFGKMTEEGDLKLHYVNIKNIPHNDFIMYIKYPNSKIYNDIHEESKVYNLKNGQKSYYKVLSEKLHLLTFKQDKLGYSIGVKENSNLDINHQNLIKIAESLN